MQDLLTYTYLLVIPAMLFGIAILLKKAAAKLTKLPYKKKQYLLTVAERKFFEVLKQVVGERYYIFPQVNLDKFLITKESGRQFYSNRNRINQKSVDFLLCDKQYITPVLAIELDDSSHYLEKRQIRDDFVNNVFADANLHLLRIPAQSNYNQQDIISKINQTLTQPPTTQDS